jgi:hypothetical protein
MKKDTEAVTAPRNFLDPKTLENAEREDVMRAQTRALTRLIVGDDFSPKSETGYWLACCRKFRAMRDVTRLGCYAWWRLNDDLKDVQRTLLKSRGRYPRTDR